MTPVVLRPVGVCAAGSAEGGVEVGHDQILARDAPAVDTVGVVGDSLVDEILTANQSFYDAHENRDLVAMGSIWEHSDRTVCVHPGWPILRTWPLIEQSWRQIFAGPGRNQFILTNVAVAVDGDVAWVTLDENLVQGGATGTVAATNLFARTDGVWRLIAHHGSPVMTG